MPLGSSVSSGASADRTNGTDIRSPLPSAAAWPGKERQGYNCRALVVAHNSRWKRVIGDGLRSQTDRRQEAEMAVAVDVLNRLLELGRPEYIRLT